MLPSAVAMFTLDVPLEIPDRFNPTILAAAMFEIPKPSPLKMPDVVSMFPTATTLAPVVILPPDTLPVASTTPAVVKFPPVTLPVARTSPAVVKLPTVTLPVAYTRTTMIQSPLSTLPETD